jgi:hypothetical protein
MSLDNKLDRTKVILEILAFGFAAVFIGLKLVDGELNPGMEMSLELERKPSVYSADSDNLAVLVKLKRNDMGRLRINDVLLEMSLPTEPQVKPQPFRNPLVTTEKAIEKKKGKSIQVIGAQEEEEKGKKKEKEGTNLPPGDATQFAYFMTVKRCVPVQIDATVLATRTGLWFGNPQWRVSALSLPDCDSDKTDH